jgi:ribonucleoside-triphosphate reductase (formate)
MKEKISTTQACRNFVKNVITNYKLPYITVTPLFSVCQIHGYLQGEHEYCPKCDEEILKKELNNDKKTRIA